MIVSGIVKIKPLSVNKCWQGKRFKTDDYLKYEEEVLLNLKPHKIPDGDLHIILDFGVSNMAADVDNPAKPFIDILQNILQTTSKQWKKILVDFSFQVPILLGEAMKNKNTKKKSQGKNIGKGFALLPKKNRDQEINKAFEALRKALDIEHADIIVRFPLFYGSEEGKVFTEALRQFVNTYEKFKGSKPTVELRI